ncbi:HAD-superfamily hydrolase [Candidatus Kinetoplastibacterium oncopeltii TCC290E]|uniref:HAD-superfamily hydrolase n=1 Tax=Candidatus Kinetoplastidibacterium stringomonadis TCC290E TaxID=1208920 RepID=M1L7H4_9PROT|nr:HAD family hydrolase [Candidatus Kinetoplastibacterium oncopeltii]AGF48543.1 HAD-superfamily hydrolase [Candidatus Kinetoplastibacterium oncopeltii TCC290E]
MNYKNLVLFDLDHTLLPIDSDYQWARFLAKTGRAGTNPDEAIKINDDLMEQYNKGTLTADQSAAFMLRLLSINSTYNLALWHEEFMRSIVRPNITDMAVKLVQDHLESGAICAIVTATNNFVTEPIARAFGIKNLIATEAEYVMGHFTGKIIGIPSFKEGKVIRVNKWLSDIGYKIEDFHNSFFYSDSINDLPLMELVNNPIATNPSNKLRSIAIERKWEILDIFNNFEDFKS